MSMDLSFSQVNNLVAQDGYYRLVEIDFGLIIVRRCLLMILRFASRWTM